MVTREEHQGSIYSVGLICAQWAVIEFLLEIFIWWLLKLEETHGSVITGPLEAEKRARTAYGLATLRIDSPADLLVIKDTLDDIGTMKDHRHLAVHGLRAMSNDNESVTATVSRGTKKYQQQPIDLKWHRDTLNALEYIHFRLEALLLKRRVIEGAAPSPFPEIFPELLAPRYQRANRIPQGYEDPPPPSEG